MSHKAFITQNGAFIREEELASKENIALVTTNGAFIKPASIGSTPAVTADGPHIIASVADPITIFGADVLEWLNGDCGVNISTGDWTGCANGHVFTPSNAPFWNPALLNGRGGWAWLRGASQRHTCTTLELPAPPFTIIALVRLDAWNSNASLIGNPAAVGGRILQSGVTPQLAQNNGSTVNTNGGLAIGTWGIVISEYTNSVADRLRAGSTEQSGGNAGASNPATGVQICANGSAAHCSASAVEFLFLNGIQSAGKLSDYVAYAQGLYGAIAA